MYTPEIDHKKCIKCKKCIDVCPVNVYDFDDKNNQILIKNPGDCIGCKACEVVCPVDAIAIQEN